MPVEAVTPATPSIRNLPDADLDMLKRNAEYGNLSLVCHTAEGALPFVFLPLRKRRGVIPIPVLQLGTDRRFHDQRCEVFAAQHLRKRT